MNVIQSGRITMCFFYRKCTGVLHVSSKVSVAESCRYQSGVGKQSFEGKMEKLCYNGRQINAFFLRQFNVQFKVKSVVIL